MSHIFISYSRSDKVFSEKIVRALANNNLDTWIDWESIPKGEDWMQEIYRGIEEADVFLFLISPDSVRSDTCHKEIAHAVLNGKRILPIVIRDTERGFIPEAISKPNWILCRDGQEDFNKAIEETQKTIRTDYKWLQYQAKLQVKALDWERRKDTSRLLRGKELQEAELQLAEAGSQTDPQPTDLQRRYVHNSRRIEERQRRRITIAMGFGLTIMAILAVFAWVQRNYAIESEATAISEGNAKATALVNEEKARETAVAEGNAKATALVNEKMARGTAQAEEEHAKEQASIALSRQLAVQSTSALEENKLDLAILLGVEAVRTSRTIEAQESLLNSLLFSPHMRAILPTIGSNVLAFSTDGNMMALRDGEDISRVSLWDVSNPKHIRILGNLTDSEGGRIYDLAFYPKNQILAVATEEKGVIFWDFSDIISPKVLGQIKMENLVSKITFHPSDSLLLTVDSQRDALYFWDVSDFTDPQNIGSTIVQDTHISYIEFRSDGRVLATADGNGFTLWDLSDPARPQSLSTTIVDSWVPVTGIAYSPDGKLLAAVDQDEIVTIWDVSDPKAPITIAEPFSGHPDLADASTGEDGGGETIAFSPDGNILASSRCSRLEGVVVPFCVESEIYLWRVYPSYVSSVGESMTGHTGSVTKIIFNPNGKTLASVVSGGEIILWDVSEYGSLPVFAEYYPVHENHVTALASYSSGNILVSGDDKGNINLLDISDSNKPNIISRLKLDDSERVTDLALNLDNSMLVASGSNGSVKVWNLLDPSEPIFIPTRQNGWISDIDIHPNGMMLAYVSESREYIWDFGDPSGPHILDLPQSDDRKFVTSLSFHPNGEILALGYRDGYIKLWEITRTQTPIIIGQPLIGHTNDIMTLTFSSDGKYLISCAGDIIVWDVSSPDSAHRLGQALKANTLIDMGYMSITSITISGDNNILAAGNCDSTNAAGECSRSSIRLWDLTTPHSPRLFGVEFPAKTDMAETLDNLNFGKDSEILISISRDGGIILWEMMVEKWTELACQMVGRNFSKAEWEQYFPDEPYQMTCPQWPTGK